MLFFEPAQRQEQSELKHNRIEMLFFESEQMQKQEWINTWQHLKKKPSKKYYERIIEFNDRINGLTFIVFVV